MDEEAMNRLPQNWETLKVSAGLGKRVKCPVCGREGTLVARQRKRQWYLYVRHSKKEHYVGPARLYYEMVKPRIELECRVHPGTGPQIYCRLLEKVNTKNIRTLRQLAIDYAMMLSWLREKIERELSRVMKEYGIKEEEVNERLDFIKSYFITAIFYKKCKRNDICL